MSTTTRKKRYPFDLDEAKRLSPQPKGDNVKFVKWIILNKSEVLSHKEALELGIIVQTRVGASLFPGTIDEIYADVEDTGWKYRLSQPAVSRLETPIIFKGVEKKYIVRDGLNRFELPYENFLAALIEGTGENPEYALQKFGCTANNPDAYTRRNENTPEDVAALIRRGIDMGCIEETEDAITKELETSYPHIRTRSRPRFVKEILNSIGLLTSFEHLNKTDVQNMLTTHFSTYLDSCDKRKVKIFRQGWGRPFDEMRNVFNVWEYQIENPSQDIDIVSWLTTGSGVTTEPTNLNCDFLRKENTNVFQKYIEIAEKIVDLKNKGLYIFPNFRWVSQANANNERLDHFQ